MEQSTAKQESPEQSQSSISLLGLLKTVFLTEPTTEFLQELLEIPSVPIESELDRGLNLLLLDVRKNEQRLSAYAEELAVEFARLFIGPNQPPAIPYASFYLSENKTLMGDVTIDVRKWYLDAGVAVQNLHSIPDDHVGTELEFLQYLTEKIDSPEAAEDADNTESLSQLRATFLAEHFNRWVPQFSTVVEQATGSDYYRGATIMLKSLAD